VSFFHRLTLEPVYSTSTTVRIRWSAAGAPSGPSRGSRSPLRSEERRV